MQLTQSHRLSPPRLNRSASPRRRHFRLVPSSPKPLDVGAGKCSPLAPRLHPTPAPLALLHTCQSLIDQRRFGATLCRGDSISCRYKLVALKDQRIPDPEGRLSARRSAGARDAEANHPRQPVLTSQVAAQQLAPRSSKPGAPRPCLQQQVFWSDRPARFASRPHHGLGTLHPAAAGQESYPFR